MDEKQANESLKENLYENFKIDLENSDAESCRAIIKETRADGFDTLAEQMEKELQGISK